MSGHPQDTVIAQAGAIFRETSTAMNMLHGSKVGSTAVFLAMITQPVRHVATFNTSATANYMRAFSDYLDGSTSKDDALRRMNEAHIEIEKSMHELSGKTPEERAESIAAQEADNFLARTLKAKG